MLILWAIFLNRGWNPILPGGGGNFVQEKFQWTNFVTGNSHQIFLARKLFRPKIFGAFYFLCISLWAPKKTHQIFPAQNLSTAKFVSFEISAPVGVRSTHGSKAILFWKGGGPFMGANAHEKIFFLNTQILHFWVSLVDFIGSICSYQIKFSLENNISEKENALWPPHFFF